MTGRDDSYDIAYPGVRDQYDWLDIESKGWTSVVVTVGGRSVDMTFFTPERLRSAIAIEMQDGSFYAEGLIVVVHNVTPADVESAVAELCKTGAVQAWSRGEFSEDC